MKPFRSVATIASSLRSVQRAFRVAVPLIFGPALGCAGTTPPTAAAPAPPLAATATPAPAEPSRVLPQHATFADVVDLARNLDAANHTQSQEGCLIAAAPPERLAADIAVATRPLPDAPKDLAPLLLAAAGPAAIFTAWGATPGELPNVALAAFTTTTSSSAKLTPLALFVTAQGVFVRGAAMTLRAHPEAMDVRAASDLLSQIAEPAAVYVTADSAVPLAQLVAALRSIPNRFEAALAVVLPKGTRLPAASEKSAELLCPDGLPEPAAEEPEGDLQTSALREALAPLREAALHCALSAGGSALQGGRLTLGIRIGSDGKPRECCMVNDTIGEVVLRRCVVEAARRLKFPAPTPAGFVDVQLPLEIALTGPGGQRPLCD